MHNNLWKKFKILIHKLFHHILDEINSGVIEIQLSNGTFSFKRNAQILKSNFSFNENVKSFCKLFPNLFF